MPLINYEVNLSLDWYKECVACSNVPDARATAFAKTNIKVSVSVITLLTQDNTKLFEQQKSGLKRTTEINIIQDKIHEVSSNYNFLHYYLKIIHTEQVFMTDTFGQPKK